MSILVLVISLLAAVALGVAIAATILAGRESNERPGYLDLTPRAPVRARTPAPLEEGHVLGESEYRARFEGATPTGAALAERLHRDDAA